MPEAFADDIEDSPTLRLLTEDEARQIGLLDRRFHQAHTSEYLDEVLRAGDPAWTRAALGHRSS